MGERAHAAARSLDWNDGALTALDALRQIAAAPATAASHA
jgi:hypothetical protein